MDDSAFTIAALAGVVVLFVTGVTLIVIGLRGRSDRLPQNADDILDAIDAGLLTSDDRRSSPPVDLRTPGRSGHDDDPTRSTPEEEAEDDTVTRAFFAREPELERF